MGELCLWCKNEEAMSYVRYGGCCSLHCRDLLECDRELDKKDKRIRELEDVVNWLAKVMTGSDDDLPIGELCVCIRDYSVGISMQCPVCSERSPLYIALERERKALSEKSDKEE